MRAASAATVVAVAFVVALAAGCGDGGSNGNGEPTTISGFGVTLAGEDGLAIGPSRFVFALYDARGMLATNARPHLKFFFIDPNANDRKTYKTDLDARAVTLDSAYSLTRPDGTAVTYEPGQTGVYANDVAFDAPGEWIVEVSGSGGGGSLGTIENGFNVRAVAPGPRPGTAAPLSTPEIEAAVSAGQPAIIVFASAGACPSAVCGPVAEIAALVEEDHADAASFVYVEPAGADPAQDWIADEWAVGSEASVFVIDGGGIVRARFDVIVSYDELESALLAVAS